MRRSMCFPHVGGSTEEAQEAIGREVTTFLVKFLNTGATTGAVNFPQVELPHSPGKHRILNVHRNVPGVLRDINHIVSELGANIHAQHLARDSAIGYLNTDLDQDLSNEVKRRIAALDTSIRPLAGIAAQPPATTRSSGEVAARSLATTRSPAEVAAGSLATTKSIAEVAAGSRRCSWRLFLQRPS